MSTLNFQTGQKIFAKIRGYPPWPGLICSVLQKADSVLYTVFLYEIGTYVKLAKNKLQNYEEYIRKRGNYLCSCLMLAKAMRACINHDGKAFPDKDISSVGLSFGSYTETHNELFAFGEPVLKLLNALRTELKLLEYDFQIKLNLQIDEVENSSCLKAIKAMSKILTLPLSEFMLKKHPEVVITVLRLRFYEGNLSKWHLSRKEERIFRVNSEKIRKKALSIYKMFRKIFNVPTEMGFTKTYLTEVRKFRRKNKFLQERDLLQLTDAF